jgi:hypothetical protein
MFPLPRTGRFSSPRGRPSFAPTVSNAYLLRQSQYSAGLSVELVWANVKKAVTMMAWHQLIDNAADLSDVSERLQSRPHVEERGHGSPSLGAVAQCRARPRRSAFVGSTGPLASPDVVRTMTGTVDQVSALPSGRVLNLENRAARQARQYPGRGGLLRGVSGSYHGCRPGRPLGISTARCKARSRGSLQARGTWLFSKL